MVEPTFNQTMNEGDPRMDVEHETVHYRGQSVALTDGQGIPNHIYTPSEQYDGIAHMICTAFAEGQHTEPDKSVLTRAGIKLDHPETYAVMSMDADLNTYPILIPPVANTFHFCHHPQPHHSQPYHAQSIIYHPSFIINGNS